MNATEEKVAQRVLDGTRFIWWRCGIVGVRIVQDDRWKINVKDIYKCPLALATGLRYSAAVASMGLKRAQEVAYAFSIDPTEPDILMDDLTDGWRFAPPFNTWW